MRNFIFLFLFIWLIQPFIFAQGRRFHNQHPFTPKTSIVKNDTVFSKKRSNWVTGIAVGGYLAAAGYVVPAWYAKEDLAPFHFFNDMHEWQQLDKMGHQLGSYWASHYMIGLYKWAGMPKKKAILLGGGLGLAAMCSIEIADGFGKQWGASMWDIAFNTSGSLLAMGNQWLWNEDRIQRKYSYVPFFPLGHTRAELNPDYQYVLGENIPEWILKNYNEQVNWFSIRVHSFLPEGNFKDHYPRWLNLAVGYGGKGMIGKYEDPQEVVNAREYRQYYLSFDIDLSNIKTKNGFLHSGFQLVSMIHLPLPAIEADRYGVRVLPLK